MKHNAYNHKEIENKYKNNWFENNIYEAVDFSEKPKKYILAELPYPSGVSLHLGHMLRYTGPEIYSRFLRMSGYNVLFPMGWDCFGLPAETFAIKQNSTPQQVIENAKKAFKKSMQDMGYAIDWNREITTSDPEYYKYTQWTFKKLYEHNLAIPQEMPVWWCKELGVLADEEVLTDSDGTKISERGGYKVERKLFKQWVLDIPKYADRLIDDLDKTSYKENVKQGQINWIGKKTGAEVYFKTDLHNLTLNAFTTRPDTLFGVTFLAISPEHSLVPTLIENCENKEELKKYIDRSKSLSDLEKQTKEKTGVILKGINAINPINNKSVSIFLADYIMIDYGTGIVMGVPAHDTRDFEFAKKYDLPIISVVSENKESSNENTDNCYEGNGFLINSDNYNGLTTKKASKEIIEFLSNNNLGKKEITYKLRPQVFSRQRYWGEPIPLYYDKNNNIKTLNDTDLPLELPVMKDFLPSDDGTSPLKRNTDWNTFDVNGETMTRETDTMPTWAGSNWYYVRYIDPHNSNELADKEKLKYWMPVDMYFGDAGHTTAHLLYSRFWYKFLYDINVVPTDEPYDFRMSGGMLLGPDGQKMSKSKGNVINPTETINEFGADAIRTYLAFIGPYEDTYPWNPRGLNACYKLTKTIYGLGDRVVKDESQISDADLNKQLTAVNIAIKNITNMLNDFKLNTSVSEIMILVNVLKKQNYISKEVFNNMLLIIAPFMPFLAEYLWQEINEYKEWSKENTIHLQKWPSYNEKYTDKSNFKLVIQINGKTKGTIDLDKGTSEAEIISKVKSLNNIQNALNDKVIKKHIYVKNKVLNFVV